MQAGEVRNPTRGVVAVLLVVISCVIRSGGGGQLHTAEKSDLFNTVVLYSSYWVDF